MPGAMKKMGVYLGLVEDDEGVVESGESYDRAPYDRAPRSRPVDYGPNTRYARGNGDGGSGGAPTTRSSSLIGSPPCIPARTTRHARLGNISGRAPRLS
jgi:hypothetical protein